MRLRMLRLGNYVLPLLLAALVFRVLVPPDFMMLGGSAMSLQGSMCTTKTNQRETIELPAAAGAGKAVGVHCKYCVAPLLGAPLADLRTSPRVRATPSVSTPVAAQIADSPLLRAQCARAPPLA